MALDIKATFQELATDDRFIQDVREITRSKLIEENVGDFFTLVPGIKGGQQVAALKGIEYVTKKDTGCDMPSWSPSFPALSQKWQPQLQKIKLKYCYTDFMSAFTQWGLANGYSIHKLDESNFIDFLKSLVYDAMKLDTLRIVLLGDEDIKSQNILTTSGKSDYYDNILKGLIPTLAYFKTLPELADQFVTLSKNTGAMTVQYALDADYANGIYEEVVDVDNFDGNITLTSQALYKNYMKYIKAAVSATTSRDVAATQKLENLSIDGELLFPIKNYDRWVKTDFKTGTPATVHLPHFALHTKKEHLQVGFDDASALEDLTFEYVGGDDESFYIKASYMLDFKMVNPYEFKAAL